MGMFDYIGVSKDLLPLTDKEKELLDEQEGFQTKCMDCLLQHYDITPDKKLVRCIRGDEPMGSEVYIPVEYTGNINFYTYLDNDTDNWVEFDAVFIGGVLSTIERIS